MRIRPQKLFFKPKSPFFARDDFIPPRIWDRIDYNTSLGKINTIVIEGASQSGKTTFGEIVCEHYRKPTLWYSIEDIFKTMDEWDAVYQNAKDKGIPILEAIEPLRYGWFLFDEPDLEAPKQRWKDARTQAITRVINSYGIFKANLVLCLVDAEELGKGFYNNLTYRVRMSVKKVGGAIVRKATFYRPHKFIGQKEFRWYAVGEYIVPEKQMSNEYYTAKLSNLFDDKLKRWKAETNRENRWLQRYSEDDRPIQWARPNYQQIEDEPPIQLSRAKP